MRGWNCRTVTLAERALLVVCGLCLGTAWAAEDTPDAETMSDVEFIEYLGLWEESDEDWLMLDVEQDNEETPEVEPETEDES